MHNQLQVKSNDKLETFINNLEDDFVSVQVNHEVEFAREAYFALQLLEKNNYLMSMARNNPNSLKSAVINIATIGLTLNPSLGLAYLVPRKNEICLDISYQGLKKLAQDSGSIIDIKADIVYENDNFEVTGAFSEPIHQYKPFGDRGVMVGCYVVASTVHKTFLTTLMEIEEVYRIRDMSESWKKESIRKYSPWSTFEKEMIKKTVIRRAYKEWSKTDRNKLLEKAIGISDDAQGIEFKSEYQLEQEQLEKDFPIPKEEKEIGSPEYRIQNAKYRGKQLKEIPTQELQDYLETLEKRHENNPAKNWELEVRNSIGIYLEDLEENIINNGL